MTQTIKTGLVPVRQSKTVDWEMGSGSAYTSENYHSKLSEPSTIMMMAYMLARLRSKDPRTQVGAAVHDPVSGGTFFGYNGFPSGVSDTRERWDNRDRQSLRPKYAYVRHAEANAIHKALRALGADTLRCVLYVTHFPCHRCLVDHVSAAGITQVFFADPHSNDEISYEVAGELGICLTHTPITQAMRDAARETLELSHA